MAVENRGLTTRFGNWTDRLIDRVLPGGRGFDSWYSGSLDADAVYECLKSSRRRFVLKHLLHNGRRSTCAQLAELVAADENGVPIEQISSSKRKAAYVGLYQCHLDALAEWGLITYDKRSGEVELTDEAKHLRHLL